MVDKEIDDYVKVQKNLGVSDESIRKSLIDAGYLEESFKHILARHSKRPSLRREFEINIKHVLYLNLVIVIVFGSIVAYMTYDYNNKIALFDEESEKIVGVLHDQVSMQSQSIRAEVAMLESELSDELDTIKTKIEDIDTSVSHEIQTVHFESLSRDSKLSESIQQSSNRSLTSLSSFGQELDSFRESSVDFSKVIPDAIKAVVTLGIKGTGYYSTVGSGVIIDSHGYIVTNYHVVDELSDIMIKTHDGTEYSADIIGKNAEWDVAVVKLRTEKSNFDYLEWADSEDIVVGDHVIAVGNPVGFESTVTEGIISNTERRITGNSDIEYIQSDVALNAGNSGGPLIDKNGGVVGINTLKYAGTGYEGLSFALRSNDVQGLVYNILLEE